MAHLSQMNTCEQVSRYNILAAITSIEFALGFVLWLNEHGKLLLPSWLVALLASPKNVPETDDKNTQAVVPVLASNDDFESARWQCGICMCNWYVIWCWWFYLYFGWLTAVTLCSTNTTAAPCGHLYCWDCIVQWATSKMTCPHCRQQFELRQLVRIHG